MSSAWVIVVEPHRNMFGQRTNKHDVQCPDCPFGLYHKNAEKMVAAVIEHGREDHGWTKDPKVVRKGYGNA